MKTCLVNIEQAIFKDDKERIRATSVYIYTDAVWEDADEVAGVIKRIISRLIKAGLDPSTLMFQFIQFGNEQKDSDLLRILDDECKEKHGDVE